MAVAFLDAHNCSKPRASPRGAIRYDPPMRLADLVATSRRVAETRARGEKIGALADLLRRLPPEEVEVAVSCLSGTLRQGRIGLGPAAVREARRSLMLAGELPAVARAVLAEGRAGLARFRLQLFRPLQPMLAQPAGDAAEAIERLGEAAVELKLDGARVQIHKAWDEVRVYS